MKCGTPLEDTDRQWVVVPPRRCPHKRRATWLEVLKFTLVGWLIASDPEHELQCSHYEGHQHFEALQESLRWHETMDGRRWE